MAEVGAEIARGWRWWWYQCRGGGDGDDGRGRDEGGGKGGGGVDMNGATWDDKCGGSDEHALHHRLAIATIFLKNCQKMLQMKEYITCIVRTFKSIANEVQKMEGVKN